MGMNLLVCFQLQAEADTLKIEFIWGKIVTLFIKVFCERESSNGVQVIWVIKVRTQMVQSRHMSPPFWAEESDFLAHICKSVIREYKTNIGQN